MEYVLLSSKEKAMNVLIISPGVYPVPAVKGRGC